MTQSIQSQLQERIEQFAADLTAILQQAVKESVAATLTPSGARGAGNRVTKGAASPSRKQAAKAISEADLIREVKRAGGRRIEEIAKSLSMPTGSIVPTMKKLIADKKIKTAGQARGTRYTAK